MARFSMYSGEKLRCESDFESRAEVVKIPNGEREEGPNGALPAFNSLPKRRSNARKNGTLPAGNGNGSLFAAAAGEPSTARHENGGLRPGNGVVRHQNGTLPNLGRNGGLQSLQNGAVLPHRTISFLRNGEILWEIKEARVHQGEN